MKKASGWRTAAAPVLAAVAAVFALAPAAGALTLQATVASVVDFRLGARCAW